MADLIGMLDAAMLDDDYVEEDLEIHRDRSHVRLFAGITAGSIIAAGGIFLALKLQGKGILNPLLKSKA
ncbi:hypothetical protein [Parasporobacterium paucivorans]|uniref:hypothetical protein n=1 Tax=Parasporobacterium paucivorans TaxID=115544 RepID=UPI0011607BB2|nr:hypothetical protein [Parasporobacterium paucivorans]